MKFTILYLPGSVNTLTGTSKLKAMKKIMIRYGLVVMSVTVLCFSAEAQQGGKEEVSVSKLFSEIKSQPDPQKMEKIVLQMEQIPGTEAGAGIDLVAYSKQLTAIAFAEEGNFSKAQFWTDKISDEVMRANTAINVIRTLVNNNKLAAAESLLLPLYEKAKAGPPAASSAANGMITMPTLSEYAGLYGTILYKKGEYKKALALLTPAEGSGRGAGRYGTAEMYAMALAGAGETDKAYNEMTRLISAPGHRTDAFWNAAKKVFIKKLGDESRFKVLKDSVTNADKKTVEEKVKKMAVNDPAPDFELKDLNGKTVSLKSLRGKTVILDFWATWCQPCVASFPGMQKAVDYYKDDTSVVFMFIHTADRSADPIGDAREYITYKKYRFDIYMDLADKSTGKSPVADRYNVRAIPAKFVIDRNGVIRYKNTGYISEEEAIPEISAMVEKLRG